MSFKLFPKELLTFGTFIPILLWTFLPTMGFSQEMGDLPDQVTENAAVESTERWEEYEENEAFSGKLADLRLHPVRINQADKEELERLFMLNEFQILAILDYRKTYGSFTSPYELANIPGFSTDLARQVSAFVIIEPDKWDVPSLKESFRQGKHTLILRWQEPMQKQDGYRDGFYQGSPLKFYLRYAYRYNTSFSAGYTMEKDPGEPFPYYPGRSLADFTSAYIRTDQNGVLRRFVAGDYQLAFGQGLVMWNSYAPGKGTGLIDFRRRAEGICRFSSSEENRFFRGAAGTLGFGTTQFTFFFSGKPVDANVTRFDSHSNQVLEFSSLLTTGYHAAPDEIRDRKSVHQTVMGMNATTSFSDIHIGTTWVRYRFDGFWNPYPEPYRLYAFRGRENTVGGMDWQYQHGDFLLFGEWAMTSSKAAAWNAGFLLKPDPAVLASAGIRKYASAFNNLFAKPFGETYNGTNEQGIYCGLDLQLPGHFSMKGYIDVFAFPWLKYDVDAPSEGSEKMLQVSWNPEKILSMYLRFTSEMKEKNGACDNYGGKSLNRRNSRNIRYYAEINPSEGWSFRTRIHAGMFANGNGNTGISTMLAEDVLWNLPGRKVRITMRYALFDIPDYESRLYTYENDVPMVYSVPSFYGKGTRVYLIGLFRPVRWLEAGIKVATTSYSNRYEMGSGENRIAGNRKTDVGFQLRLSF